MSSQSYSFQSHLSKNLRDLDSRNWSQLAASGPAPWKQSSGLFSRNVPSLVEFSTNVGKINCDGKYLASPLEKTNKDLSGISVNKRVKLGAQEMMLVNGKAEFGLKPAFYFSYSGEIEESLSDMKIATV